MSDKYSQRQTYNKLVRDKILEILESKGKPYKSHIADTAEYRTKLREKLTEELAEFDTDNNAEELADILEVVYALADELGSSREELEKLRQQKATERGGFSKRIILEES